MSDIGTKIIAAGLCEEGILFEKMEKEILELKKLLKSKEPVCPICLKKLEPFNFEGYYDKFSGYECNCNHFANVKSSPGAYCY